MRKEFLVSRQGKTFALYAGLLEEAHNAGLLSIITTLIQAPCEANNRVAICSATVSMEDGKVFTGLGDAAPNNVAPAMQTCLLRMAETRAKARALRDAINIGVCSVEELGGDGGGADNEDYVETNRPRRAFRPGQAPSNAGVNNADTPCPECHAPAGKPHASSCGRRNV